MVVEAATWSIGDRLGRSWLELAEADGEVTVRLGSVGVDEAFLTAPLSGMLVVSTGRPWRITCPGLRNARVTGDATDVSVTCEVDALQAHLRFTFVEDVLHLDAEWRNRGTSRAHDVAVGLLLPVPEATSSGVTIPHLVYRNNPSAAPERTVPKIGEGPGGALVCEEHRLPIPGVNLEWGRGEDPRSLSFWSLPSPKQSADGRMLYGSLGARSAAGISILAMSGVVMFNGHADVCYVHKGQTTPLPLGYRDLDADDAITGHYALQWGRPRWPGHGFRELVHTGLRLFAPNGRRRMAVHEIIDYKTAALDHRWTNVAGAAGYMKSSPAAEAGRRSSPAPSFLYGWTGQCLKLAWCDGRIGLTNGQPDRVDRCRQAVDFYVAGSATDVSGLRTNMYEIEERRWSGMDTGGREVVSSRAHGETISDLADIVLLFHQHGETVPETWVAAVRAAADFVASHRLPSGILPFGWLLDGSPASALVCAAGLPGVLALAKAYQVTGVEAYLRCAEEMASRYHDLHARTFDCPFAHSTLDAACEDKEGGLYYFLCAYELFLLTGNDRYREWAEAGADWLLTFVYQWAPRYDRGTALRERDFSAIGWPGVSVQNHHLDVFFPTYELWRFGNLVGNPVYAELAEMTFHAFAQGICTKPGDWGFDIIGEQGEGFFQTNWQERGTSNTWNPSWIIAQVLSNALRMAMSEEEAE